MHESWTQFCYLKMAMVAAGWKVLCSIRGKTHQTSSKHASRTRQKAEGEPGGASTASLSRTMQVSRLVVGNGM